VTDCLSSEHPDIGQRLPEGFPGYILRLEQPMRQYPPERRLYCKIAPKETLLAAYDLLAIPTKANISSQDNSDATCPCDNTSLRHRGQKNERLELMVMDWRQLPLRKILLVVILLVVIPAYLRVYKVSGTSAAPSILLGDRIIVNRAAYRLMLPYLRVQLFHISSPKRGDMVQAYLISKDAPVFKRIMGLPGERIEMRDDQIFINGRAIPLQPLNRADFKWVPSVHRIGSAMANEDGHWIAFTPGADRYGNYPPITLANNQYFLVGDNRDNSVDSRLWGPISGDHILGKIVAVLHIGARLPIK
jgi:signal peptidase I